MEQAVLPNQDGEAVENPVPMEGKKIIPVSVEVPNLELIFDGLDIYELVMTQFREKLESLVQRGVMSADTASRIHQENEYTFFNQMVKITLRKPA
jgi:hypothetical protein